MKKRNRRGSRSNESNNFPTPAQWAARLERCRELNEKSKEVKQLRKRVRDIELRFANRSVAATSSESLPD
jgi:hypothetical protein